MNLKDDADVAGMTIAIGALVFANLRGVTFARSEVLTSEQMAHEALDAAEVFMAVAAARYE